MKKPSTHKFDGLVNDGGGELIDNGGVGWEGEQDDLGYHTTWRHEIQGGKGWGGTRVFYAGGT